MQNNNSNYFEVTINNKYESATTKRKEMTKKLLHALPVIAICGLMIFSTSVSSNSEVASEDIKWESDIFPSSDEIASVSTASAVQVVEETSTTTESDTKEKELVSSTNSPKRIVSVTKIKSSENQNAIPKTTVKKDKKHHLSFNNENGEQEKNITNTLLNNSVTYAPISTSLPRPTEIPIGIFNVSKTVSGSSIEYGGDDNALILQNLPHIDSAKEYSIKEEQALEEIEKERKEKLLKEQRDRHWTKRGGNAGKPGIFDKVNNESPIEEKAKAIFDFLTSAGLTKAAACGVLGNIEQESTFNIYSSTGKYIGLYQLSIDDRFRNTILWCNKNGYPEYSIEGQTRFVLEELKDPKSRKEQFEMYTGYTKEEFTKLTDPEHAAFVFCAGYEGCIASGSGRNATWQQLSERQSYARKWYNKFT